MKIEIDIKKIDSEFEIRCEELGYNIIKNNIEDALEQLKTNLHLDYLLAKRTKDSELNDSGKKHKKMFLEIDE